jgi:hypothetical protein
MKSVLCRLTADVIVADFSQVWCRLKYNFNFAFNVARMQQANHNTLVIYTVESSVNKYKATRV